MQAKLEADRMLQEAMRQAELQAAQQVSVTKESTYRLLSDLKSVVCVFACTF